MKLNRPGVGAAGCYQLDQVVRVVGEDEVASGLVQRRDRFAYPGFRHLDGRGGIIAFRTAAKKYDQNQQQPELAVGHGVALSAASRETQACM